MAHAGKRRALLRKVRRVPGLQIRELLPAVNLPLCASLSTEYGPLGPLGLNSAQHSPTTRPSVERTAETAFLLSDRI